MLYIILTASDKRQAKGFQLQLDLRKKQGLLPDGAEVLVIADPDSGRIGSGGSTLYVIKELIDRFGMKVLSEHILCIHAGGQSSRIPQYTVLGKAFAPIAPDACRTILDHDLEQFIPWLTRQPSGMLVMSGDVLLKMPLEKIMIQD